MVLQLCHCFYNSLLTVSNELSMHGSSFSYTAYSSPPETDHSLLSRVGVTCVHVCQIEVIAHSLPLNIL